MDLSPELDRASHQFPEARRIRYGQLLAGLIVLFVLGLLIRLLVTDRNMQWGVVRQYLFSHQILLGLLNTLWLTGLAMAIGIALGTALALMRMSKNPILSIVSILYIGFFRGTPLLVQIIFWFNLALLIPRLSFGIPFGPTFVSGETNALVTPFVASLLALSLNEGAYMSEIVRAGILAVDPGQLEAAQTIGLLPGATVRKIVLPQAMRVIIPPTGNQVIGMLKSSALVSVIAYSELLYSAQLIYSRTYQTIPLLIVASIWYFIASAILSYVQSLVERHYGRDRLPGSRASRLSPARRGEPGATLTTHPGREAI